MTPTRQAILAISLAFQGLGELTTTIGRVFEPIGQAVMPIAKSVGRVVGPPLLVAMVLACMGLVLACLALLAFNLGGGLGLVVLAAWLFWPRPTVTRWH